MDFKNLLTTRGFLTYGGVVLVVLGVLGYFLIGPTAPQSIFGEAWWFDNAENVAHTVLGIVALAAVYYLKDAQMQKWLVVLVGVIALLVGLINFSETTVLGAHLESPMDMLLHLLVAVWAFVAAFKPMRA